MENSILEKLQVLQAKAHSRIKEKQEKNIAGRRGKQNFARVIEELKAREIIGQIHARTRQEAMSDRNHAIVMSLDHSDYERPLASDWRTCEAKWLKLTAHLVYEYCEEQGLEPTIEYWYDDIGTKSGFNILAHW